MSETTLERAASDIRKLKVVNEAIVSLIEDYNARLKDVGLSVATRESMVATFQEWVLSQILFTTQDE